VEEVVVDREGEEKEVENVEPEGEKMDSSLTERKGKGVSATKARISSVRSGCQARRDQYRQAPQFEALQLTPKPGTPLSST
jgi:hypothetical protein